MNLVIQSYLFVFIGFLFASSGAAHAADAPYVPTPWNVVEAMFKLGNVGSSDYLIDLGSGDGRIVISAAKKFGLRGFGVELDDNLVRTARSEAERQGVKDRVAFEVEDLFFIDISKASVITVYMSESVNLRLRPSLFKLKPGTRVVSHDFDMGNWQPDAKLTVSVPGKQYGPPHSDVLLWVIPADFSGTWSWRSPVNGVEAVHEAALTQKFQTLEGRGSIASQQAVIGGPKILGDVISFVMGSEVAGKATWREFQGRISGDTISGTAVIIADADKVIVEGTPVPWRAIRLARGKIDIEAGAQAFRSGFSTKE